MLLFWLCFFFYIQWETLIFAKPSFSMKRNALVGWTPVSDVSTFAGGDDEVCLVASGGAQGVCVGVGVKITSRKESLAERDSSVLQL